MVSYNIEQSKGDDLHNAVSLFIRTEGISIQAALDSVAERIRVYTDEFLAIAELLSLDSDPSLEAYVHCMGNWVMAGYEWAFEAGRYHLSSEARNGGKVLLLPKKANSGASRL